MNTEEVCDNPAGTHRYLVTRQAMAEAQLELLRAARREFMLASPMLDAGFWNSASMARALGQLLAQHRHARARLVAEDTEHMLARCARLVELTRRFSDRILIRRLGEAQHGQSGMFAVADRDHCLVQNDVNQIDATLHLAAPRQAAPWLQRFDVIWDGAEPVPGLHGFRL